jgi:6-phosphofructokinase 1
MGPATLPLSSPPHVESNIHRVAILFAGGPAPAANAVISTAAASFLRNGIDVVGILNGYSNLVDYNPANPLVAGEHYVLMDQRMLKRTRNTQGVMIGTARTNPGKLINDPARLQDPVCVAPLQRVYDGLLSLDVDALISIGGDDTLKTANKFKLFQDHLAPGSRRIPVVHLPKTIDNDYSGIDFTFGYFTAVDALAGEIRNLLADAESTSSYFIAETMGRSAGWLAYGAAIAGEASLVISVEDITDRYRTTEVVKSEATGESKTRDIMHLDNVVGRIIRTMLAREKEGKRFGVVVLAEGLAELLPWELIKDADRDEHEHLAISGVNLGRIFAKRVAAAYKAQTQRKRKVTGVQLGYESRCARPNAFDVMLGSQLGVGAYRALIEERLDGVMVSFTGQLDLHYVNFDELVDPQTLKTRVRYIDPQSDFHKLARFLETQVND